MALIESCVSTTLCACSYLWVQDLAGVLGGTTYAYLFLYLILLFLVGITTAIARNEIIGGVSVVAFTAIILILGAGGCIPLPSGITALVGIVLVILSLLFMFAWGYSKQY